MNDAAAAHDVFLSYRSSDREAVAEIADGLRAEGFGVWWDPQIPGSAEWRRTIEQHLGAARCVVVVWSAAAVDPVEGRWVQQEADEAERLGRCVPVHIDDVLPPLGLRHRQSIDLIDWHGDRADPRWRQLVEAIRAVHEQRAPKPVPPSPPASPLRGRGTLLALLAGVAALVAAIAARFGLAPAAGVALALVLGYVALDVLLARRRGERAASNMLRRLLRGSAVAGSAAALVWAAALLVAASPRIESALYADFVLTVQDEALRPLPQAVVTVGDGDDARTLTPGADGRLRIRYWRHGSRGLVLRIGIADRLAVIEHRRAADGTLADLTARLWSGASPFRVAHWTAEELAIDALVQGRIPKAIAALFPKVTQVLANPVWHEVNEFLSAFGGVGAADVVDGGHSIDGKVVDAGDMRRSMRDAADLRWAREVALEVRPAGAAGRGLLFARGEDGRLAPGVSALVGPPEWMYSADQATPQGDAAAKLRASLGGDAFDEDGRLSLMFHRTVDTELLALLADDDRLEVEAGQHFADVDPRRYLRWFAKRSPPPALFGAGLDVLGRSGCDRESDGSWVERLSLSGPRPALRVTVIENSSDRNVPIDEIRYALAVGGGFRAADDAAPAAEREAGVERRQRVDPDPLPGGVLRPGEAIVVPRRFFFKVPKPGPEPPSALPGDDAVLLPFVLVEQQYDESGETVVGHREHRFSIAASRLRRAPPEPEEEPQRSRADDRSFAVGTVVESVSVMVNGVLVPTRDDSGRVLALHASQPWGSCPFVFARHDGQQVWRNHGMTIADQIGAAAETTHRLSLGRRVREIQLREVEPEVSHINAVRLVVRSADGRVTVHSAIDPRLARRDRHYAVLRRGEVLDLRFDGWDGARADGDEVTIEVTGWYEPTPARIAERPRRRPLF